MTDTIELSDSDKTIMNADESIYGDLITEIDLVVEQTDDKVKESLVTECVIEENNPTISAESQTFSTDVLTQDDDGVSEYFTVDGVDTKTDEFENDMIIGELDNEGIDFKNETDVAECHHEYETKKLLFGDCEDIVQEVVNSSGEVEQEEQEDVQEQETDVTIPGDAEIDENGKIDDEQEEIEPCFTIQEDESLNRMHVMEDVEEGCDVSGALPSSPGHAEQRPDPPKPVSSIDDTTKNIENDEETTITDEEQVKKPIQNGIKVKENDENCKETEENSQNLEAIVEVTSPEKVGAVEETEEMVIEKEKEPVKEEVTKEEIKENSTKEIQENSPKQDNNEDSSSSETSRASSSSSKRKLEEDENIVNPLKKLRSQIQTQYLNHDRILSDFIDASNCNTIEEIQVQTDQLLAEIRTLNELAKQKEREWNNIIHIKKVKEEILLRMQRKRQIMMLSNSSDLEWDISNQEDIRPSNNNSQSTVSSSSVLNGPKSSTKDFQKLDKSSNKSRTILPKTSVANNISDMNGQNEYRQGRQGPILDVRSIIADYRQRHPETVPRRGRRLKSVLNPNDNGKSGNVLNMASLAFGSGSQVRQVNPHDLSNDFGMLLSTMDALRQESSRSGSENSFSHLFGETTMSFKDVLMQFARVSQNDRQELQAALASNAGMHLNAQPKPPPPYPEVTLHPVPQGPATVDGNKQTGSLLHGILTKNQPRTENKPATFSPTLARLLTAPERAAANNNTQGMYSAVLNSGVSISDLLSTGGKSRNEITITPVGQFASNLKHKVAEHVEEEEAEDSADRLVIDEGNETATDRNRSADNGSEAGDEVPQCQGCHQKSAQFVCAGCGNQWYCSRDCQVAAWDEHSEVCSG